MQLTWVERVGETHVFSSLNHPTYHSQEANKIPCTTHNYACAALRRWYINCQELMSWDLGRQTPYKLRHYLCLEVVHSTCTIQRGQSTHNTQNYSYEIRYKNPICNLYLVTLWSGSNPIHSLKCFQYWPVTSYGSNVDLCTEGSTA